MKLYTLCIALMFSLINTTVAAQEPAPLPAAITNIIENAALANDQKLFGQFIALIVAKYPEQKEQILHLAKQAYPDWQSGDESLPQNDTENASLLAATAPHSTVDCIEAAQPSNWAISTEIGYSGSSGDTSEQSISFGLNIASNAAKKWHHVFEFDFDYLKNKKITNQERYYGDYQLSYRGWDNLYSFGFLQAERDVFSGFDYKLAEVIGAGYRLFKTDKTEWSIEAGPGLRQNKFLLNGTERKVTFFAKNTFKHKFNNLFWIQNETKFFFDNDKYTIDNKLDAWTNFYKSLSMHVSFQTKYDSKVPLTKNKLNTLAKLTMVYDF